MRIYTGQLLPQNKDVGPMVLKFPEQRLHPIDQVAFIQTVYLQDDMLVFTQSPYVYEALVIRCEQLGIPLEHYYDNVKQSSAQPAFDAFSQPFDEFDRWAARKLNIGGAAEDERDLN